MKKTKISRKKVRGKNMKRLFACLLSLSMIPAKGVAVFAAQDQNVSTKVVKTEGQQAIKTTKAEESNDKKVNFTKDKIEIGNFEGIQFDNIDPDDIEDVEFDIAEEDQDKLKIYSVDDVGGCEYIPEVKGNVGDKVKVGATITKKNGDSITVEPKTFEILAQTDSNVVPIKTYGLYKALLNKDHKSVDKNNNGKIEKKELKKIFYINLSEGSSYDMNVKSEELNLLSDATECRNVDLDHDKALTNINFVKNMKNLVSVNLYNTGIQTIGDALDHVKDQLEELNLGNTKVSFDEKAKFLKDEVTVQEGTTSSKGFISHLFDYDNEEVFLTDDAGSALTAKSDWRTINISAEKGSAGKTGELTIKDGEKSKKIKIKIIGKDQNAPGFAQNKIDDTIGHFIEIKTKDGANIDMDNDISVDNEDVVKVDSIFKEGPEEKDIYYLEPQGVGTAKVTAKFTKDGVTYTDTMEVNISKAKDNIVPLKSIYTYEGLLTKDGKSADENNDKQIDTSEILNVNEFYTRKSGMTDKQLEGLDKAVNCTKMGLENSNSITDIAWMKNLKKLTRVDLGYTGVKDISFLNDIKDQITYLNVSGTKVPADQRYQLIDQKEIMVEKGTKIELPSNITRFLTEEDKIKVDDETVATFKEESVPSIEEGTAWVIKAEGESGQATNLVIQNGNDKKIIPIRIVDKAKDAIGFAQKDMTIKQHSFMKVPINNLKNVDEYYIITESNDNDDEENPEDILDTKWGYNEDEKYKYFEPGKKTGTVKLVGKFEKNDGTVYEDTMTVTVEENNDPTVLALENAYTYFGLLDTDGKSVDTNGDGQIDEKEIKNVKQMNLYEATRKELKLLEAAENCTDLDLSYNSSVRNLDFIDCMKNLQELDLRGINKIKDYSKLRTIKNQLIYLNLSDSNIDDEERLSYVYTNEISIGAGNEITNPILPMGIINDTDTYAIENSNVAEVVDQWTYDEDGYKDQRIVTIKGKKGQEGKETNLVITTEEGETLKIPVKVTQGSIVNPPVVAPTEPTKPENPKPEAPKPTPTQPTTAAPQKVAKITVTAPSNKLSAGKKVKLTANISNNASNKNIKWTTSNKKYATVDKNGVIKFNKKAAGRTVTITAYATDGSGKKATFKIKIMKGTVKKIKITGKKTVKAGKTLSLKAKVTASKGANKKLKWTSSNTKYATVSGSGKVKALKAGKKKSVKITAMATDGSGKKATVTIKIK